MKPFDYIIVGLGTAGAATCLSLARRGCKVLGIDAHCPPHNKGSHHGGSRSVRRAYMEGTAYVPMALKSWDLWRRLEKDSGQALLFKTGNLTIGPPDAPAISGFMQSARSFDIPHECLTAEEIQHRWPQFTLPRDFVGGLEKEAGIVIPELSIATFLAEAQKAGAVLVTGQRVNRWTEKTDRIQVHTCDHTYEAGRLLVSAGAWTNQLLGLEKHLLKPKRVPVHWIEAPRGNHYDMGHFPVNFWQVPLGTTSTAPQGYREFYTLPVIRPGSRIKAAFHNGLETCDPATLSQTVTQAERDAINAAMAPFFHGLDLCHLRSEICMYTMTPDGDFYLGRRPGSRHVFGVALAGHGFKFAPVLGEILADVLTGVASEIDIGLFSPDRFDH
jgi:sarcosine oxidase